MKGMKSILMESLISICSRIQEHIDAGELNVEEELIDVNIWFKHH